MYSMKSKDTLRSIKRGKGISKHIVKNTKHEHYTEAFEEQKTTQVQMTVLQSKNIQYRPLYSTNVRCLLGRISGVG